MIKAFKDMISNWTDFKGRTEMRDFWLATAATVILEVVLAIIMSILAVVGIYKEMGVMVALVAIFALAFSILMIFVAIAEIAMTVRRIRDAGFPWWLVFVALIPSIGTIALIVLCCVPSSDTSRWDEFFDNRKSSSDTVYGEPKKTENTADDSPVIDLEPTPENTTWICSNCGCESSGNFCAACGAKKS